MPVGEYVTENIVKLFTNELNPDDHPDFKAVSDLKVSSHLLITRSGDILQFVPFHKRAWHAGISVFEEQENCNDFSIGIELEGCDDDIFEEIQYEVLNSILNLLKKNTRSLIKILLVTSMLHRKEKQILDQILIGVK